MHLHDQNMYFWRKYWGYNKLSDNGAGFNTTPLLSRYHTSKTDMSSRSKLHATKRILCFGQVCNCVVISEFWILIIGINISLLMYNSTASHGQGTRVACYQRYLCFHSHPGSPSYVLYVFPNQCQTHVTCIVLNVLSELCSE